MTQRDRILEAVQAILETRGPTNARALGEAVKAQQLTLARNPGTIVHKHLAIDIRRGSSRFKRIGTIRPGRSPGCVRTLFALRDVT